MSGTQIFGYALVAVSAVLLASHWNSWREAASLPDSQRLRRAFLRLQVQRRTVASALIGVIGAGISLADHVPREPTSMTLYLFALMLGGVVILAIGLADMRASRRHREREHLELVAQELRKVAALERESRS